MDANRACGLIAVGVVIELLAYLWLLNLGTGGNAVLPLGLGGVGLALATVGFVGFARWERRRRW